MRWHEKKEYVVQNRIIIIALAVLVILCLYQQRQFSLLVSGNLPLRGLKLTGAIKSTAKHTHCSYDNTFVWRDEDNALQRSAIAAGDIRAVGASVGAGYMMNEGIMYQHGPLMFVESIYYPPLLDKNGNIVKDKEGNVVKDILAVPQFNMTGRITISPDYVNERINLMGAYVDKRGIHNLASQEIDKIKKEILKELNDK